MESPPIAADRTRPATTADTSDTASPDAASDADAANPSRRFWIWLAAIAGVALVLRWLAFTLLPSTLPIGIGGDGFYYQLAAQALANGGGFVNVASPEAPEHALHPPLWTTVLSIPVRLGYDGQSDLRTFSMLIGTATVVLTGAAGRRIVSARVGLVAAALVALYPGIWLYERNLNAETLVFPLLALFLLLTYRYRDRPNWADLMGLGLVVGLLAMTRSELLALGPLVVAPLVLARTEVALRTRVASLAAAGLLAGAMLVPWAVYNLDRFEEPVLLSTGAGNAMAAGACDNTFEGEMIGSYDARCVFVVAAQQRGLDDSQLDPILREHAIEYSADNADRLPAVLLAREGRSWGFFAPGHQIELNNSALNTPSDLLWFTQAMYWSLFAFAVGGVVVLRRKHIALYPLLAPAVLVLLSTAATFGDSRYRATAELPLVILAAVAIVALVSRLLNRPDPTEASAAPKGARLDRGERTPSGSADERRRVRSEPEGFAARIQRQEAAGAKPDDLSEGDRVP